MYPLYHYIVGKSFVRPRGSLSWFGCHFPRKSGRCCLWRTLQFKPLFHQTSGYEKLFDLFCWLSSTQKKEVCCFGCCGSARRWKTYSRRALGDAIEYCRHAATAGNAISPLSLFGRWRTRFFVITRTWVSDDAAESLLRISLTILRIDRISRMILRYASVLGVSDLPLRGWSLLCRNSLKRWMALDTIEFPTSSKRTISTWRLLFRCKEIINSLFLLRSLALWIQNKYTWYLHH